MAVLALLVYFSLTWRLPLQVSVPINALTVKKDSAKMMD